MNYSKRILLKMIPLYALLTFTPLMLISFKIDSTRKNQQYNESNKYCIYLAQISRVYAKLHYLNEIDHSLKYGSPDYFIDDLIMFSSSLYSVCNSGVYKADFKYKLPSLYPIVSYYTNREFYGPDEYFTTKDLQELRYAKKQVEKEKENLHHYDLLDAMNKCEECLILTNLAEQRLATHTKENQQFEYGKKYYDEYFKLVKKYQANTKLKSYFLGHIIWINKYSANYLQEKIISHNKITEHYDDLIEMRDKFKKDYDTYKHEYDKLNR